MRANASSSNTRIASSRPSSFSSDAETQPRRGGRAQARPGRAPASRLTRQTCLPHQKFIDCVRALTAFANRPHHQRLAAPHVTGCEDLRARRLVGVGISLDVAALIELDAEVLDHALVHRM